MVTEYPHHFHKSLLSATNAIWNSLQLNSPWSVGMVSELIRGQQFTHYDQWIEYYWDSGNKRSKLMESEDSGTQYMLNYLSPQATKIFNKEYHIFKNIQFQYGRSRSVLLHRALVLKKASPQRMDMQTAYDVVVYRVLGETWNGIYLREKNVELALTQLFPHIILDHVSGDEDYDYAIDYRIRIDQDLICAIQVKPESYASNKNYIQAARRSNKKKNEKYTKLSGVPVYTLLVTLSGQIIDNQQFKSFVKLVS